MSVIGKQHGRQHPVRLGPTTHAGQKLLDLSHQGIDVADPGDVIVPRQFDEPGTRDPSGEVKAALHRDHQIARTMQDQRGDLHRGEDVSHVHLEVHSDVADYRPGTGAHTQPLNEPGPVLGVTGHGGANRSTRIGLPHCSSQSRISPSNSSSSKPHWLVSSRTALANVP